MGLQKRVILMVGRGFIAPTTPLVAPAHTSYIVTRCTPGSRDREATLSLWIPASAGMTRGRHPGVRIAMVTAHASHLVTPVYTGVQGPRSDVVSLDTGVRRYECVREGALSARWKSMS